MDIELTIRFENLLYRDGPGPCRHLRLPVSQWNGQYYCGECCKHVLREKNFVSDDGCGNTFCSLCSLEIPSGNIKHISQKPRKLKKPKLVLTKPGSKKTTAVEYNKEPYRYDIPICTHEVVVQDFMTGVHFCTNCFKETKPEPRHESIKWYTRGIHDPPNPLYCELRRKFGR